MRRLATGLVVLAAACGRNPAGSGDNGAAAPVHASGTARPGGVLRSAATSAASASPVPVQARALTELTWHYEAGPFGPMDVVVAFPSGATREHALPVVVAFHGRGESLKGSARGARGWVDDYALGAAVRRLAAPPLVGSDLLDFVTGERLTALNRGLAARPYGGVIVVCPYLADALRGSRAFGEGQALSNFVTEALLPRVARETPALGVPGATGVDGVSLGGRAALLVGLFHPEAFGAVGALQPALDAEEEPRFVALAAEAHARNPALHLRLLTSSGDYFLQPTMALARALAARGVPHRLDVVTGPHSYEFNRGPGVYEMLLFHDRVLRGQAFP